MLTGSNLLDALGVRPCLFGRRVDPFGLICLDFSRGSSDHESPLKKYHKFKSAWGTSIGNGCVNEVSLNQKSWVQILCYPLDQGNNLNMMKMQSYQAYKKKHQKPMQKSLINAFYFLLLSQDIKGYCNNLIKGIAIQLLVYESNQ